MGAPHVVEARTGFARSWLKLIAHSLKDTIPILYALADIVRDQHLFEKGQYLDDEDFATFDLYWETRFGEFIRIWRAQEQRNPLFRELMLMDSSTVLKPTEAVSALKEHVRALAGQRSALLEKEETLRKERLAVESEMTEFYTITQDAFRGFKPGSQEVKEPKSDSSYPAPAEACGAARHTPKKRSGSMTIQRILNGSESSMTLKALSNIVGKPEKIVYNALYELRKKAWVVKTDSGWEATEQGKAQGRDT